MLRTITVEPLSCQFANENKAMGLRPHQHYAQVTLTYETMDAHGFPVFADTVGALHRYLVDATRKPFRDATNEDVADRLWRVFDDAVVYAHEPFLKWGGEYRLLQLELAVRGVPDDIGHSDGFARYRVTRT